MRIYKDSKTGMYHADYIEKGKRKRPSLHTKNKNVALLKSAKFLTPQKEMYLNCSLETFEAKYFPFISSVLSANTVKRHKSALESLKAFSHIKTLEKVTPAMLADFQVHLLSEKKGKQGINRTFTALKAILHQAEKWENITPKPWTEVSKLKTPKGRIEFHTPQEIAAMLSFCPPQWQLVILLGCRAGLRRGEMSALKWQDIDFKTKQIYVAPNKTEKHRFVPIPEDLLSALTEAQKTSTTNFVVEVGDTKGRNSKDYISAAYAKRMKGFSYNGKKVKCFLHKLRHTYASHLVQAGVDLYRVSKLLGHSSIQMTEIYAHLVPADLHNAVSMLPEIK